MENQYINPPFAYTGSKYKLLPQILPLFDYTKQYFVDFFCGGGSVGYNVLDKYEKVFMSDKNRSLMEVHSKLLTDGFNFTEKVKNLCVKKDDKAGFVALRAEYNKDFSPEKLMALILCCTNHMMRFNRDGEFNQTFGERTWNEKTQEKIDKFIPYIQKYNDKILYESIIFSETSCICPFDRLTLVKKSMYYFDPPYNTKAANNNAAYNSGWKDKEDFRLAEICMEINHYGGSFCLSNVYSENYNDNAVVVRTLLENGYNMTKIQGDYQKVSRKKNKTQMTEIIIKNY